MPRTIRVCWKEKEHHHEIKVGEVRLPVLNLEATWDLAPPDGMRVLGVHLRTDDAARLLWEAKRIGVPPKVDAEGWLWWWLPTSQIVRVESFTS